MADDRTAVKDHAKEAAPPKDHGGDNAQAHIVQQTKGTEALAIIKDTDKGKTAQGLAHVELYDSTAAAAKTAEKPAGKDNGKPEETSAKTGNAGEKSATAGEKPEAKAAAPETKPEVTKYEVKKDDTLSQIVEKQLPKNEGESHKDYVKRLYEKVGEVAKHNKLDDPNKLEIGQKLEIPQDKKPEPAQTASGDGKTPVPQEQSRQNADGSAVAAPPEKVQTPEEKVAAEKAAAEKAAADKVRAEKAAEAIDQAANGGFLGIGTDKKAIEEQLKGKTKKELQDIDEAYRARTGISLKDELRDELSGSDLTRALNLADGHNDDAARINVALEEHKEWGLGARSNNNIEKDLRDTISTLNSKQVEELDRTYQERYGKSLKDVLKDDPNLPKETKEALGIYLKGTDKMTPADTLAVAQIGLDSKNTDIFQEAFRGASPEARAQFLSEGGEDKVKKAFGSVSYDDTTGETTYSRNSEVDHAMDYVRQGKLDASTKIADNSSWMGDNEEAIEQALGQMTQAERQSYAAGKKLAEAGEGTTLSDSDKASLEYYNKVHGAMENAGNEREVAKWEDIINHGKDGSLVTKLAAHGGMFDDSMDDVLTTIENMPKEDWQRLKTDPEFRKQIEQTLAIDLSNSEMAQAREVLDKKMQAETYEESKTQQRSVIDSVQEKSGFFNDNEEGIIKALENMTPDEQRRYREDPAFRRDLKEALESSLDSGSEQAAANRILERVARGEKPESDIVAKLEMHSTHMNVDEAKVVADMEEAFRKDPTLRERLNNPQTPEDRDMSEKFKSALSRTLDADEIEQYAKPLLETGHIPFAVKAELYKGVFNDDEQGVYDALKKGRGTEADWKELIADPEKTLPFMSKEEREVALNIARQKGEMKPEDELRAAMLGAGTDEAKIKEVLQGIKPEDRQSLKDAYEKKYGTSLLGDVMDELGGSDKAMAARDLRGPQTSRETYNEARDEVYKSADGLGKWWVKNVWDGTGEMTQDQLEQYSKSMGDYSTRYQEMPPEERKKFEQDLSKSLELYQKSESAAADMVVDSAIIAAGVAGAKFTGGVSLSLLAYTSIGGAMFKVGTKSAIMGADYDFGSSQILSDGATGAVDAATIFLGPAQAAQMLKMGERSAVTAAHTVIAQADDVAKATGKQLLKEGSGEMLEREMREQVAVAISNGAQGVDDKAIRQIAEKVAANADDAPQVQQMLKATLTEAIEKEAASGLKATMRETALNTGAGAFGGMLSGGIRGGVDGESVEAVLQQSAMGAISGGAMASAFTLAFKGIGKSASALRHGETAGGETALARAAQSADQVELHPPKLDRNGRVAEVVTPDGKVKFQYHKSGELEGAVKKVELPNGRTFSSEDGVNWTLKDSNVPGGKIETKGAMKVDADGNVTWQAEGGNKLVLRRDGTTIETSQGGLREVTSSSSGVIQEVKAKNGGIKFEHAEDGSLSRAKLDNGSVVETVDGGKVRFTAADGSQSEFAGKVSVEKDGNIVIKPEDGSAHKVITAEGARLTRDPETGKITETINSNGQRWGYTYDESGNVSRIETPDGQIRVKKESGWSTVNADGKETGWTSSEYGIKENGAFVYRQDEMEVVSDLDGVDRLYNIEKGNKLLRESWPDGTSVRPEGDINPIDGRSPEYQVKVQEKFKPLDTETREISVSRVADELKDVRAVGPDGKPTSAYESLMSDKTLSDRQKQNILENLSEVREHFASYRAGDRMHPDPEVNWIHTQGEMAKVLEVSRKAGLTADEMEDAVLASMYSDSVKFAFPPPTGAEPNFFTHHLDGALAANEALTRKGFPPERVERIVQAIKEHQIAPPEFMGNLYLNAKIRPTLANMLTEGKISVERHAELSQVLKDMTVTGPDGIPRLKPIAEVNTWPKVKNEAGGYELALTPDQRELFKLAGIDGWSTPVNPVETPGFKQLSKLEQEKALSQYKISTALINGDAVDNYATLGGASKIVTIRGPQTGFPDGNIWQSIDSIEASYKDAYSVLTPEGRQLADSSLAQRNAMLYDEKTGIRVQMEEWLRSKGLNPEDVVYFQKDGKLKYHEKLNAEESIEIVNLQRNMSQLPPAEADAATKRLRELQYKGLNEEEIRQYELAKEVRAKMADLLRAGHRTDGSLPGEFPQTIKPERQSNAHWLESKPAEIPEATGPASIASDGSSITPVKNGSILRTADGTTQVIDEVNRTTRTYDPQGRIIESVHGDGRRAFTYGEDGKLESFNLEGGSTVRRNADGDWIAPMKQEDGTFKEDIWYSGNIVVDGDGSIKYFRSTRENDRITVDAADGSRYTELHGKVEYQKANLEAEAKNLERFSRDSFPDAARHERFDKLLKDFEEEAGKRGYSDEKKALLYKQINRLLEPNPAAVLSQAERADLAEQVLSHAARPSTVDQGCNSTCNVTTLEVRNYARDPEKNAQLVADIAINGKFVTTEGVTVDMTALENGLKPDGEARKALKLQQEGKVDGLKRDGSRDWAGQITETAMVNAYWQGRPHMIMDGKRVTNWDLVYDVDGKLIGRPKSSDGVKGLYNEEGLMLHKPGPDAKLYTKDGKLIENVDRSKMVYDKSGYLKGVIEEKDVNKVFDSAGKRLDSLEAGAIGYDESGKQIFRVTKPGDVKYEKSVKGPFESEQVLYKDGDAWVHLKDRSGEKMDAPSIFGNELESVNKAATGTNDSGYKISFGKEAAERNGVREVSTAKELGDALQELSKEGKLPAVISVHTARRPFSQLLGVESAVGMGAGWHVINVHSFDPETGMVKFTNQWGSSQDYMDKGYPVDKLFKAMQEPGMYKFMSSTRGKILKRTLAAGAVGAEAYNYFSDDSGR
ncbi:MAG: LysM peptidoglycan-binding domain-containing protein [Candidatus Obscuribacter sp.]|nr:LysM peptidoglycan-binding domain-containing protein [Candidatus Obscuribacter sp.]